ncbi:CLUMA_CG008469, isoform A [Clunio marinus]|uniref:CLUMA_CG008469, isoform A n=1 Tax=Clunio marinus TaxID=568069 RepID=A0A1J1I3W0_9DIPT|nr:CLUMA_CG008469, isoform A [Clunio marinus]
MNAANIHRKRCQTSELNSHASCGMVQEKQNKKVDLGAKLMSFVNLQKHFTSDKLKKSMNGLSGALLSLLKLNQKWQCQSESVDVRWVIILLTEFVVLWYE